MRIALVHPTYWPEVRRGSERFVHDLATYLAERGHEVTVLTSHRGRPARTREDGFTVVRGWRPPARFNPRGTEPHAVHAPLAFLSVAIRRLDLIHALHIPDGWAASWRSRLAGPPLVLSLMGYPDRESVDAFRHRRAMLEGAARRARAVHVLSDGAGRALTAETGIESVAINPGTDTSAFRVDVPPARVPTIFCAANPADPRKRVPLLVEAFSDVRRSHPDARLVIDGGQGGLEESLRAPGMEVVDAAEEGLAVHYARSWITVLPSAREAFGLVLVESLAAGTPAVGMKEGGVPEILDESRIGVVAETAEPEALADAIRRCLALSREDGVRERCRSHAERWDWQQVGPRFESLYRDAIGDSVRRGP